jgi:hypothetical protein
MAEDELINLTMRFCDLDIISVHNMLKMREKKGDEKVFT